MGEILTPHCPLCDQPPQLAIGPTQVFCGTDDCRMLTWDPTLSRDDNLRDPGIIDLPPMEGGTDD